MPRRQLTEEPVNHERWLISYADFITLLFAFFVVMYSISQVNEGKYRVLSETLTSAFSSAELAEPERVIDPLQIGEVVKSNPDSVINLEEGTSLLEGEPEPLPTEEQDAPQSQAGVPDQFEEINVEMADQLGELIDEQKITLRGNEEWLEVELKSSLLFGSGDARLSEAAGDLLNPIADILKASGDTPIRVEGFTDNVPISTEQFPSNWALSSARASAVVELFAANGIEPSRMAAIGYGEFQPIADNNTVEGRAENRRVVLMISKTDQLRPELRTTTSSKELLEQSQQGIEIVIPGVNDGPLQGVRTIELEDGGLLFTNDAPDAAQ